MDNNFSFSSKSFNQPSFSSSKTPFIVIQTIGKCEKLSDSIFCCFSSSWYGITLYIEDTQLFYRKDSDKTGKNINLAEFHLKIPNGGYCGKENVFALIPLKDTSFLGASGWHICLPDEDSLLVVTSMIQNILDRHKYREPRFISGIPVTDFEDYYVEKINQPKDKSVNGGSDVVASSLNKNNFPSIDNFPRNNDLDIRKDASQENNTVDHLAVPHSSITNSVKHVIHERAETGRLQNKLLKHSPFGNIHNKLCQLSVYKKLNDVSETNSKRRLVNWLISLMICLIVFVSSSTEYILYRTNIILMIYPVYGSISAVEYNLRSELQHWLIFWVIFGLFILFDALPLLFSPFALYVFVKVNLLVDCMAGDAKRIYEELLKPLMIVFDCNLRSNATSRLSSDVSEFESKMKDIVLVPLS